MYRTETRIRLGDTDAAGVLYFANLLRIAHEAYEGWFQEAGLGIGTVIANRAYGLPIVHADCDFQRPLRVDDAVTITIEVAELGERSYTLRYTFEGPNGAAGTAKTTHVAISRETGKSTALPDEVRQILAA